MTCTSKQQNMIPTGNGQPAIVSIPYSSPLGLIKLVGTEQGVLALEFVEEDDMDVAASPASPSSIPACLKSCVHQLDRYFQGQATDFNLPVQPQGTAFQQTVWHALADIPFGQTTTYQAIARKIGRPQAMRAVGAANGKNPISIILPCHRVIGSNGKLTGYGGGLWRKQWLLEHEAKTLGLTFLD